MYGLPFATALSTALSMLPAADRTGLGDSELSISDMRAWSMAKAGEHYKYTLAFRAIQNILAPIHRLPPEILSRIFVEAWENRRSFRLTHVCRLWRSILLNTSEFWAVAISKDQFRLSPSDDSNWEDSNAEDYFGAAYLRSAPRDISLNLSSLSFKGHLQLIDRAERITTMRFYAHTRDQLKCLWTVLHVGMPRLEDLAVRTSDKIVSWDGPKPCLSTKELPLLTRLSLPASLFPSSWPNILQELTLRSDHVPFRVCLDILFGSLEDLLSLRVLDVRDNSICSNGPLAQPFRAFPTLELLRIRSDRETVSGVLSLLTFPPSTRIDIGIDSRPPFIFDHIEEKDLFVQGSSLDGVAALVDQVTFRSGPTSTICGLTEGTERLRITASFSEWSLPYFEHAIRLFERTGAPVSRFLLTQHPGQRMCTMARSWRVLPAFPHITHLALHASDSICDDIFGDLQCRRMVPPPDTMLPSTSLPLLKELTVGVGVERGTGWLLRQPASEGNISAPGGAVAPHMRESCGLFPGFLEAGCRSGYRLSRLEIFSYEERYGMAKAYSDYIASHVDLAALAPGPVEREIAPLRAWVDGPVVFSGHRLYTDA
ncbi:hypothetical protein GSI_04521 [Ganoderma sinense ZZ0214-1]|uniref:Uncharacterized protein n=1 Tax=Ganoderma sinense ZZ0214-1 TaxID=1077348 RepID=A0A2G8SH39_9APHY|nr:hypothetical protein GSI_04521 [Ganoderma sinense ZZ0214-1]